MVVTPLYMLKYSAVLYVVARLFHVIVSTIYFNRMSAYPGQGRQADRQTVADWVYGAFGARIYRSPGRMEPHSKAGFPVQRITPRLGLT